MTPNQQYVISVYTPGGPDGTLVFTVVPIPPSRDQAPNGQRKAPTFVVRAMQDANGPVFDWSETTDDPGPAKEEIEAEVRTRLDEKTNWINRVTALVSQIEQWARELNWTTRRVDKKLEDIRIGTHRVPGLLMQEDTCKILLEPVGRSAPGADGVVDLYLMPAYDDIANLYYYDNRWNVHYAFPRSPAVAAVREGAAMPLSKENLEKILAEMRQNAA